MGRKFFRLFMPKPKDSCSEIHVAVYTDNPNNNTPKKTKKRSLSIVLLGKTSYKNVSSDEISVYSSLFDRKANRSDPKSKCAAVKKGKGVT